MTEHEEGAPGAEAEETATASGTRAEARVEARADQAALAARAASAARADIARLTGAAAGRGDSPAVAGVAESADVADLASSVVPAVPADLASLAAPADPAVASPADPQASLRDPALRRARLSFRHWRRTRPFWGGFLTALSGGVMLLTYHVSGKATIHIGLYGLAGYLVPILLLILGLSIIFDPEHRTFYSILAMLFAVASWMTTNLGGFLAGMLLAMTGASLAYGWSNAPPRFEEPGASPQHTGPDG